MWDWGLGTDRVLSLFPGLALRTLSNNNNNNNITRTSHSFSYILKVLQITLNMKSYLF